MGQGESKKSIQDEFEIHKVQENGNTLLRSKKDDKDYYMRIVSCPSQADLQRLKALLQSRAQLKNHHLLSLVQIKQKQHDFICTVQFRMYFVLQYSFKNAGQQIKERTKGNQQLPFQESDLWSILYSCCSALQTLYLGGTSHECLTADQIFISNDGFIKLSEPLLFGLEKNHLEAMRTKESGKIEVHLSPQIMNCLQDQNFFYYQKEKSDVFILAMIVVDLALLQNNYLYDAVKRKANLDILPGLLKRVGQRYSQNLTSILGEMLRIDSKMRPSLANIIEKVEKCNNIGEDFTVETQSNIKYNEVQSDKGHQRIIYQKPAREQLLFDSYINNKAAAEKTVRVEEQPSLSIKDHQVALNRNNFDGKIFVSTPQQSNYSGQVIIPNPHQPHNLPQGQVIFPPQYQSYNHGQITNLTPHPHLHNHGQYIIQASHHPHYTGPVAVPTVHQPQYAGQGVISPSKQSYQGQIAISASNQSQYAGNVIISHANQTHYAEQMVMSAPNQLLNVETFGKVHISAPNYPHNVGKMAISAPNNFQNTAQVPSSVNYQQQVQNQKSSPPNNKSNVGKLQYSQKPFDLYQRSKSIDSIKAVSNQFSTVEHGREKNAFTANRVNPFSKIQVKPAQMDQFKKPDIQHKQNREPIFSYQIPEVYNIMMKNTNLAPKPDIFSNQEKEIVIDKGHVSTPQFNGDIAKVNRFASIKNPAFQNISRASEQSQLQSLHQLQMKRTYSHSQSQAHPRNTQQNYQPQNNPQQYNSPNPFPSNFTFNQQHPFSGSNPFPSSNVQVSSIGTVQNGIPPINKSPFNIGSSVSFTPSPSKMDFTPKKQIFSSRPELSQLNRYHSAQNPNVKLNFVRQQIPQRGRYEGYKCDDKRNGHGTLFFKDGGHYEGEWKNDKMHGFGKLYYENGTIAFEGHWQNDEFNGQGRVYNMEPIIFNQDFNYQDFSELGNKWTYYEGQFKNDSKHGKGYIKLTNGQMFEGQFDHDMIQGNGIFYKRSGEIIIGFWIDNKLFLNQSYQHEKK